MSLYLGSATENQKPAPRAFKSCGCGATFSRSEWAALSLVGLQQLEADGIDEAATIEIRTCGCGSSLAIEVKP